LSAIRGTNHVSSLLLDNTMPSRESVSTSDVKNAIVAPIEQNKIKMSPQYTIPLPPQSRDDVDLSTFAAPQQFAFTPQSLSITADEFDDRTKSSIILQKQDEISVDCAAQVVQAKPAESVCAYRVIGETLGTYILVEQQDKLWFIDKHAAHERLIFDRLKQNEYVTMPQNLLAPIYIDLGTALTAILLENGEKLEKFGFEFNQIGIGKVALRAVPSEIDLDDIELFLSQLATALQKGQTPNPDHVHDDVLHTIACKAAIKAGKCSDPLELETIAQSVLGGLVRYCPHGRPISFTLSKKQLDKQVGRV